jgi:hypothetical protein
MGNQLSSTINSTGISMKVELHRELHIWRVIFVVNLIEFDNPFDVLYFPLEQHPIRLEISPHPNMRDVKKFNIIFEDNSSISKWIYMNDTNLESFQVLPVARIGRRLRNHPTKFYICDCIDETTTWIITIFEVRDVHGNLEIPVEEPLFSAGCRITERIVIDTGSVRVPNLEYVASSNEIRHIPDLGHVLIENHFINNRLMIINSINRFYNLFFGSTYGTFKKLNIFRSVEKSPVIYFPFLRTPCSLNVYPCSFAIFRIFLLKFSPLPKYNV